MNDSVKGLVVFAGSSVGWVGVGGGGAGTVVFFVSRLLPLLSFSDLETTGEIHAVLLLLGVWHCLRTTRGRVISH